MKEFHRIANIYPLMKDNETEKRLWKEFKNDIKENELLNPIMLFEDKILDGRNRAIACDETDTDVFYETFHGDENEALAYVTSTNDMRRHLTSSQRAAVAVNNEELYDQIQTEAKERMSEGGKGGKGGIKEGMETVPHLTKTREIVAEKTNTNPRYISDAKKIKEANPDLLQDVQNGKITIPKAVKQVKSEAKKVEKKRLLDIVKDDAKDVDTYKLIHADLATVVLDEKIHVIVTDPPYPKEFIQEFHKLGKFAQDNLPDGGLLVCMTGQYYLPDYINILSEYLEYRWVGAYLTPKVRTQIMHRNIFSNWKPLLLFSKGKNNGDWHNDVLSAGKYEKRTDHKWQQSDEGMNSIIERFTDEGMTVCDPFCGSSTTGLACVEQNRRYIGIDIELESIETSKIRLGRKV